MHFDQQSILEFDPNISDQGEPLLHIAILRGRFYLVKKLLEKGANPNLRNTHGLTAFQLARNIKSKEMEDLLCGYAV